MGESHAFLSHRRTCRCLRPLFGVSLLASPLATAAPTPLLGASTGAALHAAHTQHATYPDWPGQPPRPARKGAPAQLCPRAR
ncbi:MAG: hypothetical protein U1U88_002071 [Lawsonella clevelandensis]